MCHSFMTRTLGCTVTGAHCSGWNFCIALPKYSFTCDKPHSRGSSTQTQLRLPPKVLGGFLHLFKHTSFKNSPHCHFFHLVHLHWLAHRFPRTQVLQVRPPAIIGVFRSQHTKSDHDLKSNKTTCKNSHSTIC